MEKESLNVLFRLSFYLYSAFMFKVNQLLISVSENDNGDSDDSNNRDHSDNNYRIHYP